MTKDIASKCWLVMLPRSSMFVVIANDRPTKVAAMLTRDDRNPKIAFIFRLPSMG